MTGELGTAVAAGAARYGRSYILTAGGDALRRTGDQHGSFVVAHPNSRRCPAWQGAPPVARPDQRSLEDAVP
jgi:hypothetical protein